MFTTQSRTLTFFNCFTGPPKTYRHNPKDDDEESSSKRIKLENEHGGEDESEVFAFTVRRPELGDSEPEENGEVLEESGSEDELPPPIPPRGHSLTPEHSKLKDWTFDSKKDLYGDNPFLENGAGHFLAKRGGEKTSPPQENQVQLNEDENEEVPPPLPPKASQRMRKVLARKPLKEIEEEERALLSELNELKQIASLESTIPGRSEVGVTEGQKRLKGGEEEDLEARTASADPGEHATEELAKDDP